MKQTLADLETRALEGCVVTVRADFNVPLEGGEITDPTRIEGTLPTLERLVASSSKVVILSHLGRPGGAPDPAFTLAPVVGYLDERMDAPVSFHAEVTGPGVQRAVEAAEPGSVVVLENTRFVPGEIGNDPALAAGWAEWTDHFVMDAFGTAHRAHASTEGLPLAVRRKGGAAVAGLLMERELKYLGKALEDPERPFVAVLGGAKISGKIDVIEALLPKVDALLIGGAMANTFFAAMGLETGTSLVEDDRIEVAGELLERAGPRLVLPVDCVVATAIGPDAATRVVDRADLAPDESAGDIGPTTVRLFGAGLEEARTVVWNGPMGVFELAPFSEGTFGVARAAARAADGGATVIVGGGDSAAAAEAAGVADRLSHISTGGGASLEFLAGRALPGVQALSDRT